MFLKEVLECSIFVLLLDEKYLCKLLEMCVMLMGMLDICVFFGICLGVIFEFGSLIVGGVFILLVCFIIRCMGLKFVGK